MTTIDSLQDDPYRFTLFAALRLLEQLSPERARFGESRRLADDGVRLVQPPHLTFAPSDLAGVRAGENGTTRLEQYVFGVFGPNGPLPLHLTEYAFERAAHRGDPSMVDFINAFQHRFVSLFYRAWADAEPAVNLDRPDTDRFLRYVGALVGLASPTARATAPIASRTALGRAALFGQSNRSAEALERALSDHFDLQVRIQQFVPGWLDIPGEACTRLGNAATGGLLGQSVTLGSRTWQCQHQFEIVIGPLTYGEFERFLPATRAFSELAAIVRLFTNDEWGWQLRSTLASGEAPGVALGRTGRLGWTSWLGGRSRSEADVVIRGERAAGAAAA